MRKLIEIDQENLVECDNFECDFEVTNETKDPNSDISVYLNQPCPECGENLLTEEDLNDYKKIMRIINFLNRWFSWVTIFRRKKDKPFEGSVKVHNGIKMEETK